MEGIIAVLIYYAVFSGMFFDIAIASLQHYIVKCDASPEQVKLFLSRLRFPVSILSWEGYRGKIIGRGWIILEDIDTIKQGKNEFRQVCFAYAIGPVLFSIPMIVILFIPASPPQNDVPALFCLTLIALSLFVSWRFGHRLCEGKRNAPVQE